MNNAHLHLLLNHIPVEGMLLSGLLLIGAWISRSPILMRASFIAIILIGLATIPTYLSGAPAAEVVLRLPNIPVERVDEHADFAEKSCYFVAAASVLALVGLCYSLKNNSMPKFILPVLVLLVVISTVMLFWTAYLGGEIHHQEIRNDFKTQLAP